MWPVLRNATSESPSLICAAQPRVGIPSAPHNERTTCMNILLMTNSKLRISQNVFVPISMSYVPRNMLALYWEEGEFEEIMRK